MGQSQPNYPLTIHIDSGILVCRDDRREENVIFSPIIPSISRSSIPRAPLASRGEVANDAA